MVKLTIDQEVNYQTIITVREHTLKADEPVDSGGENTGPTPYELLLASVGACQAITVKLYANRKKWALKKTEIELEHQKVNPQDCPDFDNPKRLTKVDVITAKFRFHGDLTAEQKTRLAEIGGRCRVHKTLENGAYFIEELETD